MATVQRTKAPATSKAAGQAPSAASIALRAYEIWKERGCPHGLDQEHWFQAERELRAKQAMRS